MYEAGQSYRLSPASIQKPIHQRAPIALMCQMHRNCPWAACCDCPLVCIPSAPDPIGAAMPTLGIRWADSGHGDLGVHQFPAYDNRYPVWVWYDDHIYLWV